LVSDRSPASDFVASYANLGLAMVICVTYSTMFPLILLFGSILFFYSYVANRYNMLYVNSSLAVCFRFLCHTSHTVS
jgi:hypothetical protein